MLFPDHGNDRLRRIDLSGRISTLALLAGIAGVTVDAAGIAYAGGLDEARQIAVDPATGTVRDLTG